ncbi:MAG: YhbY family RNA-binding protein [Pseudomonadota bacterium]
MNLDHDTRKLLRRIGHALNPVVTLGEKGLTAAVAGELERALCAHELIKVRVTGADRERRRALIGELLATTGAEQVQAIGHVVLLLRRAARPDPRLSNLLRHGGGARHPPA